MLLTRCLLNASVCFGLACLAGCGSDSGSRQSSNSNTSSAQQQNQTSAVVVQSQETLGLVQIDYAQLKPVLMDQVPAIELSMELFGEIDLPEPASYSWSEVDGSLVIGSYQIDFIPVGEGHAAGLEVSLGEQSLAQWNYPANLEGHAIVHVKQLNSNAGSQLLLVSTSDHSRQTDSDATAPSKTMPWNPNELRLLNLTWVDINDPLAPKTLQQLTLTGKLVAQSSDEDTLYLVTEYIASPYGILGLGSEYFDQWLQLSDAQAAAVHEYGSVFTSAATSSCLTDESDTPVLYRVSAINLHTAEVTDTECVHGAIDQAQFDSRRLLLRSAVSGDQYSFEVAAGKVSYLTY